VGALLRDDYRHFRLRMRARSTHGAKAAAFVAPAYSTTAVPVEQCWALGGSRH
jgi:hypothetical protein